MESSTTSTQPGSSNDYPLVTENQRLRNKVFHLTTENVKLEKLISQREKALVDGNEKLAEKEREICNIRALANDYSYQVRVLTQCNCELNEVLTNRIKLIEDLKQQLEFVKKDCCEKSNELERAKVDAIKHHNKFLEMKKQLEEKEGIIHNLAKAAEETKLVISKHKSTISMQRQQNCQLQVKLEDSTKNTLKLNAVVQHIKSENCRLKNSIFENLKTEQKWKQTVADKEKENQTLKAAVLQFSEKVKILKQSNSEQKDELTNKNKLMDQLGTELKLVKNNFRHVTNELEQSKADAVEINTVYLEVKKQLEEKVETIDQLSRAAEETKILISELENEIETRGVESNKLKMQLDAATGETLQVNKRLQQVQSQLDKQVVRVETVEKEKSVLSRESASKSEVILNLENQLNGKDEQLSKHKENLERSLETIHGLENQLLEYELGAQEQLRTFEQNVQKLEKTIQGKQSKLDTLVNFLDEEHKGRVDCEDKYQLLHKTVICSEPLTESTATVVNERTQPSTSTFPESSSSGANQNHSCTPRPPEDLGKICLKIRKTGSSSSWSITSPTDSPSSCNGVEEETPPKLYPYGEEPGSPTDDNTDKNNIPGKKRESKKNGTGSRRTTSAKRVNGKGRKVASGHKQNHELDTTRIDQKQGHCYCICGKKSADKHALKQHINYYSPTMYTFQCEVCKKGFRGTNYLREHMRKAHKLPYEWRGCRFCGQTFLKFHDLRKHRKMKQCKKTKMNDMMTEDIDTSFVRDKQPHPEFLNLEHVQDFSRIEEGIFCKCGVKFFSDQGLSVHIQRIGAQSLTGNQGQNEGQEHEHFPGGEIRI